MSPFAWHPADLSFKLALAPHSWFDPLLEWYTPAGDFSRGTFLVWRAGGTLAARAATWPRRIGKANFESANSRSRNWKRSRRQAISIPLGSSVFAFDGSPGLIRVYHGSGNNWIDLRYDSIEQPEWEPVFGLSSTRPANGSFHRHRLRCMTCSASQSQRNLLYRYALTKRDSIACVTRKLW
jgi:hypothetical protein